RRPRPDTATTHLHPLSLHDALPIYANILPDPDAGPEVDPKVSRYEWNFAPRLGLTYQPNDSVQWFANLSRSIEPAHPWAMAWSRSEEHTSELQSRENLVCRLLLEKK